MAPQERRRQLLDGARGIVTDGGFQALTVESVARSCGVSRPVVYDLFGDLDGLVVAMIDREQQIALAPLLELVGTGTPPAGTDPDEFLDRVLRGFLTAVHRDRTTWKLVLIPPQGVSEPVRRRFTDSRRLIADRVCELLDWGVAERGGPHGLDHALLARVIVAIGEDAARLTTLHPRRYSPERMALSARTALTLVPPDAGAHGEPPPALVVPDRPATRDAVPQERRRMPVAERRRQLLDVTLELIAEQDWDALSIDAIAKRAGVDRVVVYRAYGRLELLTLALLRREDRRTSGLIDAILPERPPAMRPAELLGDVLVRLLGEVLARPLTYRVALRRPESVPPALQRIVNARRAAIARRLRPLVETGLLGLEAPTADIDVELLSRMLLTCGEELARLALSDPDFPPERVLAGAWAVVDRLPLR